MTKKELQAMMVEIKAEQDAAKETAITKDDIKAMMAEMMKGDKTVVKDDETTEVKTEVAEVKTEVKEVETALTKEDIQSFMKDFVKEGSKEVKPSSVKAQGGGDITMFKEANAKTGFGF